MQIGDLVKWAGFPGGDESAKFITGPKEVGVIIAIHEQGWARYRIDVLWADGSYGNLLYPQTLEVVDEGG